MITDRHLAFHPLSWGVHTTAEIQMFRHREGLAQAIEQRSPREGFAGVVSVCRDAMFSEARRWYDGEVLAVSKDEFYDAELIPRRRAHRRLRRRQRAQHRKEQRQKHRRAGLIKRRWLDILAKGGKKQYDKQQWQMQRQAQMEVEAGAAEALLQEARQTQALQKGQVRNLTGKLERQEVQLQLQEDFIQDLQQHQRQQEKQLRQQYRDRQQHRDGEVLGKSGVPLAEENKALAGASFKLMRKMEEMESELITVQRKNEWLEGELDRADQELEECLEQQRMDLEEEHNVAIAEESLECDELRMSMQNLEEQLDSLRSSRGKEEGAAGESPVYTEEDYMCLEGEKSELAFTVGILTQRLEEARAELAEQYNASAVPMSVSEEAAVAEAVAREEEEERLFADRCFAAGDAAVSKYWEHGEGAVTQIGNHKAPCEFARAERGEGSWDVASIVGCTCGYLANKEKNRKKRERKKTCYR